MDCHHLPITNAIKRRWRLRFCWRWLVIPFFGICIWGWCDVRQRGFPYLETPWEHKTDLTVYTEAGAAFFDGRPPYAVSNQRGWTYVYPPLFAMVMAPLHVLPSQDQVLIWFVISLLLCWGCIFECGRTLQYIRVKDNHAAQRYTTWYPWLGIAAVFAAALPTLNCLQRGQVGILKLYLLLLGLRLVLSGRRYWTRLLGGVVLALPIVLKIVPLLPVGFLVFVQLASWLKSRWRGASDAADAARRASASSLGVAWGLVLFFLVVPSMLLGWQANWTHLKTWSSFVLTKVDDGGEDPRLGNSRSVRNQSLHNAAYRLGNFIWHEAAGGPDDNLADFFDYPETIFERPVMIMDSPVAEIVLLGIRIALLAALGYAGIRLGLRGDALSQATAFGLACVAMLVVSPVSRGHYFMLAAPAILYLPLWLDRENRTWTGMVMAVVPIVLIDLHYIFLGYAGRVGLLGLGMTGWLLAALVLVIKSNQRIAASSSAEEIPDEVVLPPARQAA
jgi:hypothetical protein